MATPNGRRFLAALLMAFYSCSKRKHRDWGTFLLPLVLSVGDEVPTLNDEFPQLYSPIRTTAVPSSDALNVLHLFAAATLKLSFCSHDMCHVRWHVAYVQTWWHDLTPPAFEYLNNTDFGIAEVFNFSRHGGACHALSSERPSTAWLHGCHGECLQDREALVKAHFVLPSEIHMGDRETGKIVVPKIEKINETGQDWEKCVII